MTETTITTTDEHNGLRLDSFLSNLLPDITRSAAQKLIEHGFVTIDGDKPKPATKLRPGEIISITVPPPKPVETLPEDLPLNILFEDNDLIVLDKPAGIVVHPGAGNSGGTIVNGLLHHCKDLSGIGGELRPGIVHRIDKDTSGIIVVAKNDKAHQPLAKQFHDHTIKRVYVALLLGSPKEDSGKIKSLIGRHVTDRKRMSGNIKRGKQAVTNWKVLARYPECSFIKLRLETGRTHQIRVHMSEAGFPIVGDSVYGGTKRATNLKDQVLKRMAKELGRQALHAETLGFIHPSTENYMEFNSPIPDDMQRILDYLNSRV